MSQEIRSISLKLREISNSLDNIANILVTDNQTNQVVEEDYLDFPEENQISNSEEILNFLRDKNLDIINFSEGLNNQAINNISKFMGNRYDYIKDFLLELKRSLSTGRTVKMFLQNETQSKVSNICQLANMLNEIAYLQNYKYFNSPRYILYASPLRQPEVINYINGKWLEQYIIIKIKEILNKYGLKENTDYSYVYNVQFRLPNENNFELDILFKIKDEIFWFEAKSGDYQRYVHKYSDVSKNLLKIPKENSFMVITDITESGAEAISNLFNMKVTNLSTFEEKFTQSLSKIL